MRRRFSGITGFFRSIQGQFILFFLGGSVILLLVSSLLSYTVIYDTVQHINERVTAAEFAQISVNLGGLWDNVVRQQETLLGNEAVKKLCTDTNEDKIERIFSINEFSDLVKSMVWHYPYIHSVYLYLDGGDVLCATNVNMQCMVSEGKVESAVREHGGKSFLAGGIRAGDFPLNSMKRNEDELLITIGQKMYRGWMLINISEAYFNSLYADVSRDGERIIRVIDGEGHILSSPDKESLGAFYQYRDYIDLEQNEGQFLDQQGGVQVLWSVQEGEPFVIVSERKLNPLYGELTVVSQVTVLTFVAGLTVLCLAFLWWMNRGFVPLKHIIKSMDSVAQTGEYAVISMDREYMRVSEIHSLVTHYNTMLGRLNEFKLEQEHSAEELRKRELQVLRNQINPHFLFNTLNNIKWMSIMSGVPNIAESISALGGIVQPLFRSDAVVWSLREEMEQVYLYLKIENLRFQNGIRCHEEIQPGLEDVKLLRFLLQPLIENSIVHGFSSAFHQGDIWIHIYARERDLVIEVADNGQGLTETELEELNEKLAEGKGGGGIGLLNTCRRIRLYYGEPYGIRVYYNQQEGRGLLERLTLPLDREGESDRTCETGETANHYNKNIL